MPDITSDHRVPTGRDTSATGQTAAQIREILSSFQGEQSLKRLFWELLSFDRVRDPLPLSILPPSAIEFLGSLEVFAATEAFAVILADVKYIPNDARLEQTIWAIKRNVAHCVVVLTDRTTWTLVYPDETLKPRVRILPLPGKPDQREGVVQALIALNAADSEADDERTAFELAEDLDTAFPGPTPNIGDLLTDFERIAEHPDEEVRELWQFIRSAGQYPLLTAAQERGEDLVGHEVVTDGSELKFQEWRLVVHNLRLVVWMARKIPRVGMTLADLVQEGCTGLMIAAKRFDPDRGFRFTTYAFYWVRQAMYRALHNQCNLIRWPVYRAATLIPALLNGKEDGLRPGERRVRSFESRIQKRLWRLSLTVRNPIDSIMQQQARTAIDEAISRLKPKERPVIERRFGLVTGDTETLESIGQDMRLTRERIRQLEANALQILGQPYNELLRVHWSALEWRQSCAFGEGSFLASAPFRILALAANSVTTES